MSGEGARIAGGRWNSKGLRAVYAASSLSLAAIEILVHVPVARILAGYVQLRIDVPDAVLLDLNSTGIAGEGMRLAGDQFLCDRKAVALRVPSSVIPTEYNIVINPGHEEFKLVSWANIEPFQFDSRLA